MADVYAALLRDPFWLKIPQIGRLTDRQIVQLYFRKRLEDGPKEVPDETEDSLREKLEVVGKIMLGLEGEALARYVDGEVAKWYDEQTSKQAEEESFGNGEDTREPG